MTEAALVLAGLLVIALAITACLAAWSIIREGRDDRDALK